MSRPLPRTDLSDAFARPSRAARIKLPPAKPAKKSSAARQQPSDPTPGDSDGREDAAPQIAAHDPLAAVRDDHPPAAGETTGVAAQPAGRPATTSQSKTVVLWAPPQLRKRMQVEQAATGTRYLDQILDALEATVDRLPELVARPGAQQTQKGKLFAREVVAPAEKAAPRVQLTIRGFLDSQVDVIDQLVRTSGAASRSALIIAALDAALPT